MSLLFDATSWLNSHLMRRTYLESQISVSRRRDFDRRHGYVVQVGRPRLIPDDAVCICGDPKCELPWRDGGRYV